MQHVLDKLKAIPPIPMDEETVYKTNPIDSERPPIIINK